MDVNNKFLSLPLKYNNFSLLSFNQKPKNIKNKSLYQNKIKKFLKKLNYIIYMIV
jgi:hypothetical protein